MNIYMLTAVSCQSCCDLIKNILRNKNNVHLHCFLVQSYSVNGVELQFTDLHMLTMNILFGGLFIYCENIG